jgi:hypothetical protein
MDLTHTYLAANRDFMHIPWCVDQRSRDEEVRIRRIELHSRER